MFWTDLIPENIAASKSAARIGVYKLNDDNTTTTRVGSIALNKLKPVETRNAKFRFGVLSDCNLNDTNVSACTIAEENFAVAMNKLKNEAAKFVCCCGGFGLNPEDSILETVTSHNKLPFFTTKSGSDFSIPQSIWKQHTDVTTNEKFEIEYCDKEGAENSYCFEYHGIPFIFVSDSKQNTGVYSDETIEWLHEKLEKYKDIRSFVFIYSPFSVLSGNLFPELQDLYGKDTILSHMNDVDAYTRLLKLHDYYKNAIWFNGQTAFSLETQTYSKTNNITNYNPMIGDKTALDIHVPGCGYVNEITEEDLYFEGELPSGITEGVNNHVFTEISTGERTWIVTGITEDEVVDDDPDAWRYEDDDEENEEETENKGPEVWEKEESTITYNVHNTFFKKLTDVSQGYLITVYDKSIEIDGIAFREDGETVNQYVPIGCYLFPTTLKEVETGIDLFSKNNVEDED